MFKGGISWFGKGRGIRFEVNCVLVLLIVMVMVMVMVRLFWCAEDVGATGGWSG